MGTPQSTMNISDEDSVGALPPIGGLAGTVGPDRRFILFWTPDPAYQQYEIHESTVDPANTLKATRSAPPRTTNPLEIRPTPLLYGVRGRTAGGELGPFGDTIEVLVTAAGGAVTLTDRQFVLPGGGTPPVPPVPLAGSGMPWLVHPDGTPVTLATGGGNAAETTAASVGAIPTSGVVRYTGPTITSRVTLPNRSNLTLTIPDGKMDVGGTLELSGTTRNVRLKVSAPYENTNGQPIVKVRGAYDTVTIVDSVFGPAARDLTPPATKSRFVLFGDSASAGSKHGSVVLSTLRNKNGPGNAVHAAGNDGVGTGGVRYTYLGLNWIFGTQPFDENEHESALLGLSGLQLTDGQQLVEGNLFGGPNPATDAVASEPEVVSMKMNRSVIRGNTFWNHVGSASLRHGDESQIVDNNFRSNSQVPDPDGDMHCGAGGRLYGRGHQFSRNTVWVMDGLPTRNFERPFIADSGDVTPGTTSNKHANVVDLVCADNLFFRCGDAGGPIFDGKNHTGARATGTVRGNLVVECPSPGPNGVTVVGGGSSQLQVTGTEIHSTAAAAGVTRDATGWPTHPTKGSRAPFLTPGMVGKGGTWRPPGWSDAGSAAPVVTPAVTPAVTTAAVPGFPGDLIPFHWKLTTTLKDPESDDMPLEVWRDGRTRLDHGPVVDLDRYVDAHHWRLTNEQDGRWGIKITCPGRGVTTPHSPNMRWELRGLNEAGDDEVDFDLTDDAPILDTEVCVLELQGNSGVLAQIHGQEPNGHKDDLTVWRAEPNDDGETYSLWITKLDDPHGGNHGDPVDDAVPYRKVISIGFRPARDRVRYVYNGELLDYTMQAAFSRVNFYKAGLYLQVADPDTSGTIILYKAVISGR